MAVICAGGAGERFARPRRRHGRSPVLIKSFIGIFEFTAATLMSWRSRWCS